MCVTGILSLVLMDFTTYSIWDFTTCADSQFTVNGILLQL